MCFGNALSTSLFDMPDMFLDNVEMDDGIELFLRTCGSINVIRREALADTGLEVLSQCMAAPPSTDTVRRERSDTDDRPECSRSSLGGTGGAGRCGGNKSSLLGGNGSRTACSVGAMGLTLLDTGLLGRGALKSWTLVPRIGSYDVFPVPSSNDKDRSGMF